MTLQVYRDEILKGIVNPWIERGDDFVLEEECESSHGTGPHNIIWTYKQQIGLKSYFNCPNSPDLSPIENCWQPPKQFLQRFPHWDTFETCDLIQEGWDNVSQHYINSLTRSLPQRLKRCIDMDGQLTDYWGRRLMDGIKGWCMGWIGLYGCQKRLTERLLNKCWSRSATVSL